MAAWRNVFSDPRHAPTARKQALVMSAICLAFLLGEVAGLGLMAWAASSEVVVVLGLMIVINYVLHYLLRSPKRGGRALMDQIEDFRLFLTTTEKEQRDLRTPLRTTPDLFERFLPYAMALNVEKVWGEKFAAALPQTARGGTSITASTFATSLGNSFSSAISSSTTAPGSRSGSSGSSRGGGGSGW
jgi:uncharacterized membrane protein